MAAPVPLRADFDAAQLRALAKRARDPDQTRRLLALAEIYDGGPARTRPGSAGSGCRPCATGLSVSTPKVLMVSSTGKAPGGPQRSSTNARPCGRSWRWPDPGRAWRRALAADRSGAWLFEEFRISISKPTLSRELRHMGFRKLSARPRHHAQDEEAVAAFKKTFPPSWRRPQRPRPRKP